MQLTLFHQKTKRNSNLIKRDRRTSARMLITSLCQSLVSHQQESSLRACHLEKLVKEFLDSSRSVTAWWTNHASQVKKGKCCAPRKKLPSFKRTRPSGNLSTRRWSSHRVPPIIRSTSKSSRHGSQRYWLALCHLILCYLKERLWEINRSAAALRDRTTCSALLGYQRSSTRFKSNADHSQQDHLSQSKMQLSK